jgi:GT2 family glycosyltransferase
MYAVWVQERPEQISSWNQTLSDRDDKTVILNEAISCHDDQIASLNRALSDRDRQISNLERALSARDNETVILNEAISRRDDQIASLNQAFVTYQNSISWRLTKPLRFVGRQIRSVKSTSISNPTLLSGLSELIGRIIEFVRDRSIAFSNRFLAFLLGETVPARTIAEGSLRFFVDIPKPGFVYFTGDSWEISGWAADLDTCSVLRARVVVGQTIHDTWTNEREDVRRAYGPEYELPRDTGFAMTLAVPLGIHRMRIEVEGSGGSWISIHQGLLLRIPGISPAPQAEARLSYRAWTRLEQKRLKVEIPGIIRRIKAMADKRTFTVVVDTRQGGGGLKDTIRSIRRQLYSCSDVRVLSGADESFLPNDVINLKDIPLSEIRGDFIVFMQSGQRLAINTLYEFADTINQHPDIDLVYGDEDSVGAWGSRCNPFHKPDWSPDYLETFNYIGFPACFRATMARDCLESAHIYDFVLKFTERTTRISHIPKILGHRIEKRNTKETVMHDAVALDIKALSGRLARTGRRGSVCEHELYKGCYSVRLDLKRSPRVSVIIPTAGRTVQVGNRRVNLIENIVGQIRDRSTYRNFEIIVVDNGDLSPKQQSVLAEAECRRITYPDPGLNISRKLNLGASIANGELFLLMNDDIEVITPTWMERFLEHFEKPHVGVVGAKLLYPNERIQHVGVVHSTANPDHVRRQFPRNDAGYFFSTCGVRNYAVVTGACMMTRANIYREVGGWSDVLAVNFNDSDYCMKVRSKGFSVVYAPGVELIHMEAQSHDVWWDQREIDFYHQQWAAELVSDPFYNERFLTVAPPTFVPRVNQRMV